MEFIPLNVFTNYALLKSALTLDEYFLELKSRKITTAGISDPDHVFSFPYFQKAALKAGVKPLFGVRYKIEEIELVFFIKNEEGYKDLLAIFELNFNRELTRVSLKNYTKNLVTILPTCNLINHNITPDEYRDFFKRWAMVASSFYIGLERESLGYSAFLQQFADKFNYNIVAFPHILYRTKEDAETLKMIEAIKEGTLIVNIPPSPTSNHFLNEEELNELYSSEHILNTQKIAEEISFSLAENHPLNLPLPADIDPDLEIIKLTKSGLEKIGKTDDPIYQERLTYELNIIKKLNFTNYFLIVADYVNFAKNNDILVGYGRGSAPGSLVSYTLGITSADPIKHDLLFERFLNPERISMPDIDIDFMDIRRGEVLDYIKKTYGDTNVAHIVTFQTNAAKASLRDAGRVLNIDQKYISLLSQSLGGVSYSLRDSYRKVSSFKKLVDTDSYNLEIIKKAVKLEGFPRQSGVHAAGLIIDREPLSLSLPTFNHNGMRVSEYEMAFLEQKGFLKVDILGLSNLTFIDNIIKRVKRDEGVSLDFYNLPLEESKNFTMIQNGFTLGLFQLESEGMRKAIKDIQPSSFDDVCALLALYRPGPMEYIKDYGLRKSGKEEVNYLNNDLKKILAPTYGIIIYQEQIMKIAEVMASFSLAEADILRRAISKKDETQMVSMQKKFVTGALNNGYSANEADKVFNDILKFASYGFNKSHSVVYTMLTLALSYLKAHHPLSFYSELFSNVINDKSKLSLLLEELKAQNIKIIKPSITHSQLRFAPFNGGLLFPLASIVGINNRVATTIINLRISPFISIEDFFFRAYNEGVSELDFIALIEAGALDEFNKNRAYLKAKLAAYLPSLKIGLFNTSDHLADILVKDVAPSPFTNIKEEIARLRFPLSENPLKTFKIDGLVSYKDIKVSNLELKIFGVLEDLKQIKTKKGEVMAFASLGNYEERLNLVIFPETYAALGFKLEIGSFYIVRGKAETKSDNLQIVVREMKRYEDE